MSKAETAVELFAALDQYGKPTGEKKTKDQILKDGDWRLVVHIWVVNARQELIVQKRAPKGLWDNLWDVSVGGGVSAGERSKQAGVRELGEELGIQADTTDLIKLGRIETTKPLPERNVIAYEFSDTYLLRRDVPILGLRPAPREVADINEMPLSELRNLISDDETYKDWVPHPREYYLGVIAAIEALKIWQP